MKKLMKTLLVAMMIIPIAMFATACSTDAKGTLDELKGIYNLDGLYKMTGMKVDDVTVTVASLKDGTTDELLKAVYIAYREREEGEYEFSLVDFNKFKEVLMRDIEYMHIKICGDIMLFMADERDGSYSISGFTVNDAVGTKFFDYGVFQFIDDDRRYGDDGMFDVAMWKYEDGKIAIKFFMVTMAFQYIFEKSVSF